MFDHKSNKIIFNIFAISLSFITLNNVLNPAIKYIGLFSILVTLVISSYIFYATLTKKGALNKRKITFSILYLLLIYFFSLGILFNPSIRGFITLGQLVLIVNFFLLYSLINYENINYKLIFSCLTIYLSIYYFGILKYVKNNGNYSSIYGNPNILGMVAFLFMGISLIIFNLSNKKVYFLYAVLFCFIVYLSNTRSSMLAVIMIVIIFIFYKYISKNKYTWNIFIVAILVSIILVIYIYPNIDEYSGYDKLNSIIYSKTGKRLLSGRQIIWKKSIELIIQKPLFGYGTGTLLSRLTDIQLSAHNLYIQILLQNGIIGLLIFVFLIMAIWNLFYMNKSDKVVKLCACFFIGILYQNVFEVTLLQNNMAIAIMQWFIIAVGTSKALNNSRNISQ